MQNNTDEAKINRVTSKIQKILDEEKPTNLEVILAFEEVKYISIVSGILMILGVK